MEYVIYLDEFFLMNFSLDLIALLICCRIRGCRLKIWRNVVAAITGGCFACIYLMNPFNSMARAGIVSGIAVGGVMSLIAYGYENLRKCLWNIAVLYTVMFAAGGLGNVLYFSLSLKNIPLIVTVIAVTGVYLSGYLRRTQDIRKNCCRVTLINGKNQIETDALLDTGNSLSEPYRGRPVSIIGYMDAMKLTNGKEICTQRGYMKIPFHSVGKPNGLMDGFVVDEIIIEIHDKIIHKENVVIGICEGYVTFGAGYGLILNLALIRAAKSKANNYNEGM